MIEYIAEPGGRYTYTDDILNLQELSLSVTSIFSECSNFIISGCTITGDQISCGYVWLNGKVRFFEGAKGIAYPYYIYEKNSIDSTTYANDSNKKGRSNYLCSAGAQVPSVNDPVTGKIPQFIEIKAEYAPRFIDKFMGHYALLTDPPFQKQTVRKDLTFTGNVSIEKDLSLKNSLSISNPANAFNFKNLVYQNGDVSLGVYANGIMVNEIIISNQEGNKKGAFIFKKEGVEQARISDQSILANINISKAFHTVNLCVYDHHLINITDNTDDGMICINRYGFDGGITKFRNLNVYNGKDSTNPLFQVVGKSSTVRVNGTVNITSNGNTIFLSNSSFAKGDKKLLNTISWTDKDSEVIGYIGYNSLDTHSIELCNRIGDIVFSPSSYVDIKGELWINGINIDSTYVSNNTFISEFKKKVDVEAGKQLSSEDFTTEYKTKLDNISTGNIASNNIGYVTAKDANAALSKKVSIAENLHDLPDKATARNNLDVYSKSEANTIYLRVTNNLQELINLTADEINGLTPEQASDRKAEKQATVRNILDAEKKGSVDAKLTKSLNLSDLLDKNIARKNLQVYSIEEIDEMMKGKLSTSEGYQGVLFSSDHKNKLESIKTGSFTSKDSEGKIIPQVEGYVLTSHVVKELAKKANHLLDGYTENQKSTIATNINVYTKNQADNKYASVESLWQDYITFLVKQGKSAEEALKILRDKLNVYSKNEIANEYLKRNSLFSDINNIHDPKIKRQICDMIGAAWASEYQTKVKDSGWMEMSNSGSKTDAKHLRIRQIGNIVSIQGAINTACRDGGNWGGIVALIPNSIPPPKYSLRCSLCDFNDSHKHNRGSSFVIPADSRTVRLYERGWYNIWTELNFTYMT